MSRPLQVIHGVTCGFEAALASHEWNWGGHDGWAWRVGVLECCGGVGWVFDMPFSRELDAKTALAGLAAAGLRTEDDADEAPATRIRQIMIEALPW